VTKGSITAGMKLVLPAHYGLQTGYHGRPGQTVAIFHRTLTHKEDWARSQGVEDPPGSKLRCEPGSSAPRTKAAILHLRRPRNAPPRPRCHRASHRRTQLQTKCMHSPLTRSYVIANQVLGFFPAVSLLSDLSKVCLTTLNELHATKSQFSVKWQ